MYSTALVNLHFWISTVGIVLYIASMWIAGLMQGLMWRAVNDDGTLTYSFIEALAATEPYYMGRLAGGLVFFIGMLVMAYNVWMTIRSAPGPAAEVVPAGSAAAAQA